MENKITADDVEKIYSKIEKTKKGSFFIDNSNKIESQITPNHVDAPIGEFYVKAAKDGFDTKTIKEDGALASRMTEGLI